MISLFSNEEFNISNSIVSQPVLSIYTYNSAPVLTYRLDVSSIYDSKRYFINAENGEMKRGRY